MNGFIKHETYAQQPAPQVGTANAREKLLQLEGKLIEMCDPEKTIDDFESIMDRIDEVILANRDIFDKYTTTASIDNTAPMHVCPRCKNRDPGYFRIDAHSGDTVCMGIDGEGCGEVVQDHHIHEGQQYRKLEDKEDRDHFGPPSDPLMPQAHNMATNIVGLTQSDSLAKTLQNVSRYVEMNLSNIDSDERRTREGYKSQQKREAWGIMEHLTASLHIPVECFNLAKVVFAVYRDVKEHVHHFRTVVGACLAIAYRDLAATTNLDESVVKTVRLSAAHLADIMAAMERNKAQTQTLEMDTRKMPADMLVHRDIPIQHWGWAQIQQWLHTVEHGRFQQQADAVVAYLQRVEASGQSLSKPRKMEPDLALKKNLLFKRPLLAGNDRPVKRIKAENQQSVEVTSEGQSQLTPGQRLLNVSWEAATRGATDAAAAFRAALKRRRDAEVTSLRIEDENRLRTNRDTSSRRTWLLEDSQHLSGPPLDDVKPAAVGMANHAIQLNQTPSELSIEVEDLTTSQASSGHEFEIEIAF